jgi:Mlc titration factor MtfA (ptsG expression regulator)
MGWFRRRPAPLPERWRALLASRVPHVDRLTPELRARFEARVMEFLAYKKFYGCNDLAVTEDMRVLVAGMACLLILRDGARVYPNLRSVLLYPTAFWVRHEEPDADGVVYEDEVLQVGESQQWGRVILSWEDAEAALAGDPVNVPAHEFAHQLNDESPHEGAPLLDDYARWSKVMSGAYEELCERGSEVLDDYGTEGPGEFFAVATESYFQRGGELRRHHRELFELLKDYYLLDTSRA